MATVLVLLVCIALSGAWLPLLVLIPCKAGDR